ncbi:hypothetical protein K440DRAFT_671756 [Wilcoxina mikolae CBS 423.85]|nr:hypothetical protein K440DRAFT_671756 [Wilcoxina mikolae CBS 423.85]
MKAATDDDTLLGLDHVSRRAKQGIFVIQCLEDAIDAARRLRQTEVGLVSALRVALGIIHAQKIEDEDKAIQLWKIALSDPALKSERNKLGKAYLLRALDSNLAHEHVIKLLAFAQRWQSVEESVMKRDFRALEQFCIRIWLMATIGVTLLSDEDDDNDEIAYQLLFKSFFIAGDYENARTACHFVHLSVHDDDDDADVDIDGEEDEDNDMTNVSQQGNGEDEDGEDGEGGDGDDEESNDGDDNHFGCDGVCDRTCGQFEGFYSCRKCYNVDLCPDCYELLQSGEFPSNICRKNHTFMHFKAPYGECVDYSEGRVRFEGTEYVLSEWLQKLKKEWNLV